MKSSTIAARFHSALYCLVLTLLGACGEPPSTSPDPAAVLARERVAHWFADEDLARARAELQPLVASGDAALEDLVRAAAIEFAGSDPLAAEHYLARAAALDPSDAALRFMRGQIARESGELERAVSELRVALDSAPGDLPTRYSLAACLQDLGEVDEAELLYRAVLEGGLENGGSWYVSALYRLERMYVEAGREAQAVPVREERLELDARNIKAPSSRITRLGTFARVVPPRAGGSRVARPASELKFSSGTLLPELGGALELGASDVDADGALDLWVRQADGVRIALQRGEAWEVSRVGEGAVAMLRPLDLDNAPDAELELLLVKGAQLEFWKRAEQGWRALQVETPELPSAPLDIVAVDFDHEGDLDLLLVGEFGARLWRNDGALGIAGAEAGAFIDASAVASLPSGSALRWAAVEDFDNDDDVDLLFGGADGVYLADSLRAGRFADASARLAGVRGLELEPIIADFDGDALPDLWPTTGLDTWWRQAPGGGFEVRPTSASPGLGSTSLDLDLDGALDIWGPSGLTLAAGLAVETRAELSGVPLPAGRPCVALDVNADRKPDLAYGLERGVKIHLAEGRRGRALSVTLRGNRTNRRAVGAKLEVRAGASYRRHYYRGEPVLMGSGELERLDVLRITYPNGLVQSELDVELTDQTIIDDPDAAFGLYSEPEGLIGSCPFLYAWNGERYEFITDVLGITPLGLPLAPGVLVPPDHDEFVLVRGDQLVEREGELVVQFTEELREVTYLDRVRLDVVDHPLGTEIFPNELFRFPPFPEEHTHTLRAPLAPTRAMGSDGRDWRAEVAVADSLHAVPFEKQAPQFQGLAKGWFLELEFDAERVAQADKLRLAMTGWFFWSDASSNMAAAGQPGVDFVPPLFQVPDGAGGWRDAGAPVGFPAGKTKTMVIDVSDLGLQQDPRLRVFCTLQLYWDRIALAVDDDDAELRVQSLEPQSAQLSLRGFSAPLDTGREDLPLRFDWDVLAKAPRWNQHPGLYTKLGECVALLGEVDDRYIIMGSGEALEVRFDARELAPVPAGFTRDYLLYLDGWAKDRDPNTLEALRVEPLPFHAMSGYPYGPDEHFPDDQAHRAWAAEWNTRAGLEWIVPLSSR